MAYYGPLRYWKRVGGWLVGKRWPVACSSLPQSSLSIATHQKDLALGSRGVFRGSSMPCLQT